MRLCSRSRRPFALQGLTGLDPCVDPTQKRTYLLEPCLLQMHSSNGRRRLIRACTVHDNLKIVRKGHYQSIHVLRTCRHGARNDPFLLANLLRPHIENDRLMAFVDQSAKFIDRDPVHVKLADKCLPPPPPCQKIQAKHGGDKQDAKLADIRKYEEHIGDRILKYHAHHNGHAHKQERPNSVEQNESGQRHLGNTCHRHRNGRKPRKEFREQQRPGADLQEHRLSLANAEIRRQGHLAEQSQDAPAIAFTAPIPSKICNQGAADTCKNNFRNLMVAFCHERCRRNQYRKGRQRQSAFGQQNVEENDQQAIPLDIRCDLLHWLSIYLKATFALLSRLSGLASSPTRENDDRARHTASSILARGLAVRPKARASYEGLARGSCDPNPHPSAAAACVSIDSPLSQRWASSRVSGGMPPRPGGAPLWQHPEHPTPLAPANVIRELFHFP